VILRPGRDDDADGIVALVARCWADYPGVVLYLKHEERRLLALATYYAGKGGALWVAEDDGVIVGMASAFPASDGAWEISKVYVHPDRHGTGLAHRLLDAAEFHAATAGATRLQLWTDTRFLRAHRFYEKRGYVRNGPVRAANDLSHSLEFDYAKPVGAAVAIDRAAN